MDASQEPVVASRVIQLVRDRTPARVLVGRVGPAYRTVTQLELRQDHAAAVDAVHAELEIERSFGHDFVAERGLFEVQTRASSKVEFLMRPDLGRKLSDEAREIISQRCPHKVDFQIVMGDGLSAAAVAA